MKVNCVIGRKMNKCVFCGKPFSLWDRRMPVTDADFGGYVWEYCRFRSCKMLQKIQKKQKEK